MPDVAQEIQQKGYTITRLGRQLIARSLATRTPMVWTTVMFGRGQPDPDTELPDVEALADPVAPGTSTVPQYNRDRVNLTVEFRSDMVPAGLDGFYITEFGIFGKLEGDEEDILFVYGCQGDYPVWVGQYDDGCTDIRRWPITVVIGSGLNLGTGYSPASFMTAEDIEDYATNILLPMLYARSGTIVASEIVLPADGWTATDSAGENAWTCTIPFNEATDSSLPMVAFLVEYGSDLADCGMSEMVEASDGALTFWSKTKPSDALKGGAFIFEGAAGNSGSSVAIPQSGMRPATATTLGAIKGSDSIQIDPDGTAHALLSDDIYQPDDVAEQKLTDIFGN